MEDGKVKRRSLLMSLLCGLPFVGRIFETFDEDWPFTDGRPIVELFPGSDEAPPTRFLVKAADPTNACQFPGLPKIYDTWQVCEIRVTPRPMPGVWEFNAKYTKLPDLSMKALCGGQLPKSIESLRKNGYRFVFREGQTRGVVRAEHPERGEFSIAELSFAINDEIGHFIAAALNGSCDA
jgi:hypothetical protein